MGMEGLAQSFLEAAHLLPPACLWPSAGSYMGVVGGGRLAKLRSPHQENGHSDLALEDRCPAVAPQGEPLRTSVTQEGDSPS